MHRVSEGSASWEGLVVVVVGVLPQGGDRRRETTRVGRSPDASRRGRVFAINRRSEAEPPLPPWGRRGRRRGLHSTRAERVGSA